MYKLVTQLSSLANKTKETKVLKNNYKLSRLQKFASQLSHNSVKSENTYIHISIFRVTYTPRGYH